MCLCRVIASLPEPLTRLPPVCPGKEMDHESCNATSCACICLSSQRLARSVMWILRVISCHACHMSVWEISDITKSQWRGQVPRLIAVQAHTRNFQLKELASFAILCGHCSPTKPHTVFFLQENAGGWSSRRPTFLWSVAPPWGLEEELCFSAAGYTFTFLFTMTNQPRAVESA